MVCTRKKEHMKLVLLSDIHSNHIAFEACIDYFSKKDIDGIVFIGDYVSDCPNPQETLSLMKQLENRYQTWYVKGNREEYFVDYQEGKKESWHYSSYQGSLLYTYELLNSENLYTFKTYPNSVLIHIPGTDPITVVHGSPSSSRELLYENQQNANGYLENLESKYLLCGHTHKQFAYEYKDKVLINPGSVGVAMDAIKAAHFAILEWKNKKWNYEMVCVPFDYFRLKNLFYKSSLIEKAGVWPNCILRSIETGVNWGPICAKRAYDLAIENGEEILNMMVPEKYWQLAAKQIDVI